MPYISTIFIVYSAVGFIGTIIGHAGYHTLNTSQISTTKVQNILTQLNVLDNTKDLTLSKGTTMKIDKKT